MSKKKVLKSVYDSNYRISFGVLDKRTDNQLLSLRNFSLKDFDKSWKEIKKKFL